MFLRCLYFGNLELPIEEIKLPKSANLAKMKIPCTKMQGIFSTKWDGVVLE
jgi:hypothetical protein